MRLTRWLVRSLLDALLIAAVVHAAPALAAPASRPSTQAIDPDLVGHWRADHADEKQAVDLSGHDHPIKPASGKIAIEKTGGHTGFRFTQAAPPLSAGAIDAFDFTGDFTVALWVKIDQDFGDVTLLAKRNSKAPGGWAIVHGIHEVGGVGFVANPGVVMPTPCTAVDDWVHVAVTFHDKQFLLYVDGKAIGVMDLPVAPAASKGPLVLGADSTDARPFDGWIDDVRIYHRGLTAGEVEALSAGKEPPNPYIPLNAAEEKRVRSLIEKLGSSSYPERQKAEAELRQMGRRVMPILRKFRGSEDPEVALRIRSILGEVPRGEAR